MSLCLIGTLLIPLSARAQEPTPDPKATLKMALASPFALTVKPLKLLAKRGKWFPVAVTLSNTGDPLAGEVHLKLVESGDNPANDFTTSVDLPTNARKVVWLYGRLERPNVSAIEVSFAGRGFKTLTQSVPLQEPNEGQRVILTVSDVDSGLSEALLGLRGAGLSLTGATNPGGFAVNSSQGPLRPLETAREGVPDRWIGMEIADLLILGDFPHSALAPPQIEAIRGYVAGGGTLLALGGANAQRLSTSPLAELWPASVAGSASASADETAQIVRRYVTQTAKGRALTGADRLGGSPLVTARGTRKAGAQVRLGTDANPLFALRDTGAGRVLMLMFDPSQPPFNGWSGQNELWRDVFGASVKPRTIDGLDPEFAGNGPPGFAVNPPVYGGGGYGYNDNQNNTPMGQLLSALGKAQQRDTPPVSQIAWFLALYVFVLVPLNYAILRFIDRREMAWISIPVIVAAFSFFAYSYALNLRGTAILTRQVDVVQSTIGSNQARADSLLWLFSPRTTSYTLNSKLASAAIADYATQQGVEQGNFSVVQPAEASSFRAQDAPVRIWVDRTFSAQSVLDLNKGLTRVGDRVQNGTPFDLQGVVWVQDRQARGLGTLKSGASVAIPTLGTTKYDGPALFGAIEAASRLDATIGGQTQRNGIPVGALRVALGQDFGNQDRGSFLVGWSKKTVAPLSIGVEGAQASDLTLFVFRADAFPATRAKSQVAGRVAIVTLVLSEPVPPQLAGATGGGTNYYECLLPDASGFRLEARGVGGNAVPQVAPQRMGAIPPVSIPRGTLKSWVHFEVFDLAVNRWRPLSGELRRDNSPAGGWNFAARIGREWAREPDRMLKVRVRRDNNRTRVSSLRVTS